MWSYQQAKKQYRETAKVPAGYTRAEMDRGFITRGLWKFSRHPNFAAEQSIWVILYLWGCVQTGTWFNWTAIGAISYLGVFAGSTPLTEDISAGKYLEYRVYQERVGRFLPKVFGKGWDEKEMEQGGGAAAKAKKR
jgi:steroid 5-alpha reductase family enzyme